MGAFLPSSTNLIGMAMSLKSYTPTTKFQFHSSLSKNENIGVMHRSPLRDTLITTKQASVLIPQLLLTVRSLSLRTHAGQVRFPGYTGNGAVLEYRQNLIICH